ncbi:hypothetical protein Tco_1126361 [Tanacetum coccineum]
MVNVIPPVHIDDVPVVERNQHDDVHVVLEPVLKDEDEDPEEEEFEKEEEPQEEEDDMEVDIKEMRMSQKPEDVNKVEDTIKHEDEIVPASIHEVVESSTDPFLQEDSNGLLSGFMWRGINSLFGKVKDEYYGKLILDLGNEVCFSVEHGKDAMEKLVEKFGNAEDKVGRKKLKKELKEARLFSVWRDRIMPPEFAALTQAAIRRMIKESIDAAIAAERARHCNPTAFHGTEGAVELRRWFKKTKSVFGISECAEGKKVKFTEMKQLMTAEFCPIEEVQRMEHELWNLKVKEYNIVAYTLRFNELALMCPRMVKPERVKVDAYI